MVGGTALDGLGEELAGLFVGVFLKLLFELQDFDRLVMGQVVLELTEEIFLGLLGGKAGNALEHIELALFDLLGLFQLFLDFLTALGQLLVLGL